MMAWWEIATVVLFVVVFLACGVVVIAAALVDLERDQ